MEYNYSLIIPHFNIPKLLRRLLSTVPKREDLQVIIVDDCSTKELDELEKVKQEYQWIEWYDTGINGGGGKARNIGLEHAKGKYLIFADADDFFNLCFNEVLNDYINSEYDEIYFASNSIDTNTFQTSNRDNILTPLVNKYIKSLNPELLLHKITSPWSKFISLNLVNKYKIIFEESQVYNDMFFSEQVDFRVNNLHADPRAIYCVTSRENSVSSVTTPEKEVLKMKIVSNYYKYARDNNIPIVALHNLIGPMLDTFKNNHWRNYKKMGIHYFTEIGVSENKIRIQMIIRNVYKYFIIPGKRIFNIIFGK